jgi:hypothetical protein
LDNFSLYTQFLRIAIVSVECIYQELLRYTFPKMDRKIQNLSCLKIDMSEPLKNFHLLWILYKLEKSFKTKTCFFQVYFRDFLDVELLANMELLPPFLTSTNDICCNCLLINHMLYLHRQLVLLF